MSVADNWSPNAGQTCGGTSTSDNSAVLSGAELSFNVASASLAVLDVSQSVDDIVFTGTPTSTPFAIVGSGTVLTLTPASGAGITDSTGGSGVDISADLQLGESQTFSVTGTASLSISGVISQSSSGFALTTTGTGGVTLDAANTYSGGTTASGPLTAETDTALGSGAVTVSAGGLLDLMGTLTVSNALTFSGAGTLEAVNSATWSGPITLASGATDSLESDLGTLTVSGAISGGSTSTILDATGAATLVLSSSSNSYLGTTEVQDGTLENGTANALPATTDVLLTGPPGTTYQLAGYSQTVAEIDNNGTITSSSGSPTLTVEPTSTLVTFDGTLAGSLSLDLDGSGGSLVLGGTNNTYSGTTTVTAGTLENGTQNALPTSTVLDVASGGTYDLNGNAQQVASVTNDTGTITDSTSPDSLTVGPLTANDTIGESLVGSLELTLEASGHTVTLTGTDSYSGSLPSPATTVSSGTLDVTGTLSAGVTVMSGAILEGTGSVAGVTAESAGPQVEPGSSSTHLGTLTSTGGVNLSGSQLGIVLAGTAGGDFSQLDVSAGDITVSGTALAVSCSSFTPAPSDSFDIVENGQGSPISGTFAGLSQGSTFSACGQTFQVTYLGGVSGHDVVFTDVAAPNAPSGVTATGGNASATVSFTPPSDNGSSISEYTVTATDSTHSANGGEIATGSSSPITVSGLTNGDSYTFTVTATNGAGTSSAGGPSSAVVPSVSAPNAPSGVTATGGNASSTVSWTDPSSNGGATITSYTASASGSGGQTCTATGATATSCTVSGLSNGTAYTFSVTATNSAGTSTASGASNAVTPATTPGAPTGVTATGGNASSTVSWTDPSSNGGATITSYTASASGSGGQTCTATGATATSCTVSGLSNGTAYTFSVTATNSAGTGAASTPSNAVTPAATTAPPPSGVSTASFGAPTSATTSSGSSTTLTETQSGTSATVSIPAGALPAGTTVSVYPVTNTATLAASVPTGQSYVVSFAVSWQAPNGASPTASAAITMTISDPGILAGDTVYEVTSAGLKAVGTATANGVATITFTNDPTFVVAATPKLSIAARLGRVERKGVELNLSCTVATTCHGAAELSVARKTKHGRRSVVTHVDVASADFSLSKGQTARVVFRVTRSGKPILARRRLYRRFAMSLVTVVTGGNRDAVRVFVP